jgi:uncharacterized protein
MSPSQTPRENPFTLVVLQVSSLCNLNCSYCYVPDRLNAQQMSDKVVDRILELTVANLSNAGKRFDFLFHAGEPMAIGLDRMKAIADRCIARARGDVEFSFSIQTNGVLINPAWATFFREYNFAVGVSIDGPAFLHDAKRVTWSGKASHARAVRGVRVLQNNGIEEVGCLATITKESLGHADEIMDFFLDLGAAAVGFNLEDIENDNPVTTFGPGRRDHVARIRAELVEPFLKQVFRRWWPVRHRLRVREFADVLRAAAFFRADRAYSREPDVTRPLGIVTFMKDGRITTFAPEFAGANAPEYDHFVVGHVDDIADLTDLLADPRFQRLARDVAAGIASCRRECEYFPLCGGGYVSNRYFEYRDFSQAETFTCAMMRKAATEVCLRGIASLDHFGPATTISLPLT